MAAWHRHSCRCRNGSKAGWCLRVVASRAVPPPTKNISSSSMVLEHPDEFGRKVIDAMRPVRDNARKEPLTRLAPAGESAWREPPSRLRLGSPRQVSPPFNPAQPVASAPLGEGKGCFESAHAR